MAIRLVFLGAPGVGKGTYAQKLTAMWKIPHISTGDIIRHEIKNKSMLGEELTAYANAGKLAPDDLVVRIAKKRLNQQDCHFGWLLDGFPRTIFQAVELDKIVSPNLCVNLTLPDEILVEKLSGRRVCKDCGVNYNLADIRNQEYDMPPLLPKEDDCAQCKGKPNLEQRPDDTEDVVIKRLAIYKADTEPLVNYYNEKGILVNFAVKRGMQDLPEVKQLICRSLNL